MSQETLEAEAVEALVGGERAALKRMDLVSTLLDDAIRIPGTDFRIGLDPIVGALPVAGDSVMSLVSLYVVLEAVNLGASTTLVARMLLNVAIDATIGSIPLLGTVFDAVWKANRRNVRLVERHVDVGG
ncbi:DUF4112 domain-containing protein [Halostella salina]|uniref:DUF4112 domain-containing protein n=1 Tax=Halostella salina TaxID=1547897 RepID=UPI000EF7C66B|nr:DUF4112 domain-containing protein [Halostella salina]